MKFNNIISKPVKINTGVPTLFNIYLDEIITKWQNQDTTGIKFKKNQQLSTLLFSEDLS